MMLFDVHPCLVSAIDRLIGLLSRLPPLLMFLLAILALFAAFTNALAFSDSTDQTGKALFGTVALAAGLVCVGLGLGAIVARRLAAGRTRRGD